MSNADIKKLLSEIEADNAEELCAHKKPHIFSKAHKKRVCEAFYGKTELVFAPVRPRKIPLWAAVLILLLSVLMIVGCGVLIYQTVKFIPHMGIVSDSDVLIYGTDEPISLNKVDVTNVSYIERASGGELYIQLNSKYYSHISNFSVFSCGEEVVFEVEEEWYRNNLRFYTLTADVALENYEITLSYKGFFDDAYTASVTLKNMSGEQYKLLSGWPVIEGLEIKMIPADAVNKHFGLEVDLPENTELAVTDFNIYNDKGEVKGGFNPEGSSFYVCKGELLGNIAKIEINKVQISKYLGEAGDLHIPVPKDGEALTLDIPLVELNGYDDRFTESVRDGNYVYLTRKITYEAGTLVSSCDLVTRTPDDFANMHAAKKSADGTEVVYKIWIGEGAETFTFRVQEYTYTLSGKEPLGVIQFKK